jgi:nucleoside-diphosphate-sugar epimerase
MLYTSTIQIYGFTERDHDKPLQMPIDETHPANPLNPYSAGKVAMESYLRLVARKGLSVAAFRLPWVMSHDMHDGWFHWTEREAKLGSDLGIYVRDSDVAECFALALENPREGFEIYNLAAREVNFGMPIRQAIASTFPEYPQLPETWGKYDTPYVWKKAQEHFGWTPKWNYLDEFRKKMGRDPEMK